MDIPQLYQVQFQVLSADFLQCIQYRARQRLLSLREQQMWKEYCENELIAEEQLNEFTECLSTNTGYSEQKLSQEGSQTSHASSAKSVPVAKAHKTKTVHFSKKQSKIEQQIGKKQDVPSSQDQNSSSTVKKAIIQKVQPSAKMQKTQNEKEGIQKVKEEKQIVKEVKQKVKEEKHQAKQSDLKKVYYPKFSSKSMKSFEDEGAYLSSEFSISRPRPKAVSFLLPQSLQESRALAQKAYYASKNKPFEIFRHVLEKPSYRVVSKSFLTVFKQRKKKTGENIPQVKATGDIKDKYMHSKRESKPCTNTSTRHNNSKVEIPLNHLPESKENNPQTYMNDLKTLDITVEGIIDDLLTDTIYELQRLENIVKTKNNISSLEKVIVQLQELEEAEFEIRNRWMNRILWEDNFSTVVDHPKPVALPTIIRNVSDESSHHVENEDYIIKDKRSVQPLPIVINTNQDEIKEHVTAAFINPQKILSLTHKQLENIKEYHNQQAYLFDFTYAPHNKFGNKTITEKIPDEILDCILEDIAKELSEIPSAFVTDLYQHEFYTSSSSSDNTSP